MSFKRHVLLVFAAVTLSFALPYSYQLLQRVREAVPERTVEIHVRYGFKRIEGDAHVMRGVGRGGSLWECRVSPEFYAAAPENEFYELPLKQCRQLLP